VGPMEEGSVKDEVEKRLADLFDDSEEAPDATDAEREFGGSPLRDLKAVVLSVDWEINDETLNKLAEEIERLKSDFADDKILLLFLQLLASIGHYVKANKARSHPDAVKLLNSVYLKMEKVFLSRDLTEEGRKRILLNEVRKFKALKERIALMKAAAARVAEPGAAGIGLKPGPPGTGKPVMPEGESPVPAGLSGTATHQTLAWAVEEITKVIHAEFEALRAELRHLTR
jgi:hypothetical protein